MLVYQIKTIIASLITIINSDWNIKLSYMVTYKKKFPDKNPNTFVEKLLFLKMNYYNKCSLVCKCSDKVEVRKYVEEKGFGNILNEVYGIYNSVDEIPWKNLPTQFAMKWNFGSTYNIICENVETLNIAKAKKKMRKWGRKKYWLIYAEMQYQKCRKKIIMEKYLDTKQGFLPYDYKFYCFDGQVRAILLIADRNTKKKGAFFTENWEYLGRPETTYCEFEQIPKAPISLDRMINCAQKLSEGFPFVRIDFYEYNKNPVFGEMTFTPSAGLKPSQIAIDGKEMGEYIDCTKNYDWLLK